MADINAVTGEKLSGLDLKGKVLVVRKDALAPEWRDKDRRFHATDGFGCSPVKMGRAVFGDFLLDGEHCRMNRSDFEGVAVDHTIGLEGKVPNPALKAADRIFGKTESVPHQGELGLEPSKGDSIGE